MILCEICSNAIITREGNRICILKEETPVVVTQGCNHTKNYGWCKKTLKGDKSKNEVFRTSM